MKAFASSLILSKLRTSEKQTVKEVLKLMEERYGRTKVEKVDDFIENMKINSKFQRKTQSSHGLTNVML